MSIEEMVKWVEVPGSIPTEVRREIIAALRAGQDIRSNLIKGQDGLGNDVAYVPHVYGMRRAVDAYDAVIGSKE